MPIQIDQKRAENLAPQFDEALELVRNEFAGLDLHRQYRNAFARLLKPGPLGRVLMMGTDQRDMADETGEELPEDFDEMMEKGADGEGDED